MRVLRSSVGGRRSGVSGAKFRYFQINHVVPQGGSSRQKWRLEKFVFVRPFFDPVTNGIAIRSAMGFDGGAFRQAVKTDLQAAAPALERAAGASSGPSRSGVHGGVGDPR